MKKALDFLKKLSISDTEIVNSFITSAFVEINKIRVKNNVLIKSYLIKDDLLNFNNYHNFLDICEQDIKDFNFEVLIKMFEYVISPSDRIVNGAVYTPKPIRDYIVISALKGFNFEDLKIADISCGCGGFLLTACQYLRLNSNFTYKKIFENFIYGLDIQSYSIERCKILLSLLALDYGEDYKSIKFNLFVDDALTFKWSSIIKNFGGFQYVLGNPPYVCAQNLDNETKEKLKAIDICRMGNTDLYIPFFKIALDNLKEDGTLCYITMNTFFKSLNARLLRKYFRDSGVTISIIDFGYEQVFKSKNTYTCICLIQKHPTSHVRYKLQKPSLISSNTEIIFDEIDFNKLDDEKGWNLRFPDLIRKIEETGTPFGELFKTRHGIATLMNDVFIFKPMHSDEDYYYFQDTNNEIVKIEKMICKDVYNTNKLSADYTEESLLQKLIFPYDIKSSTVQLIEEKDFLSNYPNAYNYLLSKKTLLLKRDKGIQNYPKWYAFGRTQSLMNYKYKLFFPKYSNNSPYLIINTDETAKFYNGLALIGDSIEDLEFAKIILQSRLFWFYITSTSKPYSAGYFSLNGNYINNFGVYDFTDEEKVYLISEKSIDKINEFIEEKYDIVLPTY